MSQFSIFLNKPINVELSGKVNLQGILLDFGNDIIVIYDGKKYLYIPVGHIQNIKPYNDSDIQTNPQKDPINHTAEGISYRKILNNARGIFVELYISGNKTIHGYITNILTNYFVFYSPVYKTMYILLQHLKWLSPYDENKTPYNLNKESLPFNPSQMSLSRTFEEQIKKLEGTIVVFDLEDTPIKVGLLKKVEENMIELNTGQGETVILNTQHLKTLHLP